MVCACVIMRRRRTNIELRKLHGATSSVRRDMGIPSDLTICVQTLNAYGGVAVAERTQQRMRIFVLARFTLSFDGA